MNTRIEEYDQAILQSSEGDDERESAEMKLLVWAIVEWMSLDSAYRQASKTLKMYETIRKAMEGT
jgi:hypothetical protein